MIDLADRLSCTGCQACMNTCSKQAIQMQPDEEGFLQPVIDSSKCVECGLCVKRCPALNPISVEHKTQRVFALISNQDRDISSSGGAFSVFARIVLAQGGIVFGASLDEQMRCSHIGVETVDDLSKIRGAKYLQSSVNFSYKAVKQELQKGRKVLFSGTPCQVAGLYSYLGKRYEDLLITLDLICHGVPNQLTFDSYIEKLQNAKNKKVTAFQFRKFDSWSIIPSIKFESENWRRLDLWENAYMNAFFDGITFRESCFNCRYCNTNRVGTFTIADFWGLGAAGKPFKKNVAKGVSLLIDNCGAIDSIKRDIVSLAYLEERSLEEAIPKQHNLKGPMKRVPARDVALKLFLDKNVSLEEFSRKCNLPWKNDVKAKVKRFVKNAVDFLGLYNIYKTISYKMGKNS